MILHCFPRLVRRILPVVATLGVVAGGAVVIYAQGEFSLVTEFRSAWAADTGCNGDGVCGDGRGVYNDLTDGVDSWSNGNIQLVTSNSPTRRICLDFPESPTHVHDAGYLARFVGGDGNSLDGCYRGAFSTLANNEYAATDIGVTVPSPLPISAWMYFFVNGLQYELRWNRQASHDFAAPPLKAAFTASPATWLLQSFPANDIDDYLSLTCPNCSYTPPPCPEGCATLVVFSDKQPRGRVVVANYISPFALTAKTAEQNKRAQGQGKGKK